MVSSWVAEGDSPSGSPPLPLSYREILFVETDQSQGESREEEEEEEEEDEEEEEEEENHENEENYENEENEGNEHNKEKDENPLISVSLSL